MKRPDRLAARNISGSDPLDVIGNRFDVGENGYFDLRMPRIVSSKLVVLLDHAAQTRGVNFY